MSCTPSPCPPSSVPAPVSTPTWTSPDGQTCVGAIYYNTEQSYTNTCSGGPLADITVTIAASAYSSTESLIAANATALAAATAQANALRALNPCIVTSASLLLTEASAFLTSEAGDFLTTE